MAAVLRRRHMVVNDILFLPVNPDIADTDMLATPNRENINEICRTPRAPLKAGIVALAQYSHSIVK